MSDLYLTRRIFTNKSTLGKLILDNFECWTLEDTVRREKVHGETAIPSGSYEVILNESKRYGRIMPYLKDVPFFEGIRIHWGNFPKDTLGCILVGKTHQADMVGESKKAFDELYPRIEEALKKGPMKIHIAGGFTAEEFSQKIKTVFI